MSSENTKLWDNLGRTDPAHVKRFKRAGGFSGTAIKPMWSFRRMTEEFGPCGIGWGVGEPSFQTVPGPEGEMLVYCTASVWYKQGEDVSKTIFGVGGDKVVGKNKYGLVTDDEAFKKAYTDAVTNALKLIGVGADVHMGLFDDNKYVADMQKEFADEPETPAKSSAQLKRDDAWNKMMFRVSAELADVKTPQQLEEVKAHWRAEAKKEGWTRAWLEALANEFLKFEDELTTAMEREPAE